MHLWLSSLYDATRAVARKSRQQHQRNSNGPAMGFFVIFASRLIASRPRNESRSKTAPSGRHFLIG
jgi:hypothetical protein